MYDVSNILSRTFMIRRAVWPGRIWEGAILTFDYSVVDQVTETDRKGFVNVYTFNISGNMVKKEERTNGLRLADPASFVTAYAYNADTLKISETFPKGNGGIKDMAL